MFDKYGLYQCVEDPTRVTSTSSSLIGILITSKFREIKYMNFSADPCQNFYEYTCGNFDNIHPLNDGDVLIDQFILLEKRLSNVVHEILEKSPEHHDPLSLQKAKMAYRACIDDSFTNIIGMVNPELSVVEHYGGFPVIGETLLNIDEKSFGWNEIAEIAAEFGINMFLSPSLYYDTQNASRNILRISTDTMDIPVQFRQRVTPSYEEAIEEGFAAMINQTVNDGGLLRSSISAMEVLLRKLVLKMKRIMGSNRSDDYLYDRVANISNFMKGIYYGGYIPPGTVINPITNDTSSSVVTLKQLNDWTVAHFGDEVKLDWVAYVRNLFMYTFVEVDENFPVLRPTDLHTTIYGVLNWVRMNDEEIVKSSALLRAFVYMAADSDSETRTYFEEYLNATGKKVYPRWEYCTRKNMDATGTLSLGLPVTYEYQSKYFDTSKLENARSLIDNLQATFKEVIEEAEWMDDESKAAAQTKADNIITLLAYPEFITNKELLDDFYRNLAITSWDHFTNAKILRSFQQAHTLNMISNRVREAWEKSPFDANAYYNRQNNRIIFPVAMLNPVFFQGSAGLLDYSRIGMIIAHEITHGFDSQGFFYNPEGVIKPWWSNDTVTNFTAQTRCFVEQYSNYTIPEINSTMNGSGSLNENLADNGGLRTAFRAFKSLLDKRAKLSEIPMGMESYTTEQLFFIGYGTMWCSSESVSYLTSLVKSCSSSNTCHARSDMRVNGVLSNMEEFAEAFSCPAGSPMNPLNKCRLW